MERTRLRLVAEQDAYWLYQLHKDPEVMLYEQEPLWPSERFARKWLRRHQTVQRDYGVLTILRESDEQWLGLCQWRIEEQKLAIGYRFLRDYWGQGYATEAVGQLLKLLAQQGWQQVQARVAVRNIRSRRLLLRLGFVQLPAALSRQWLDYQRILNLSQTA